MQLAADVVRLLQLMILFAPVVCWAPLAIYYGVRRPQWLQLFRYHADRCEVHVVRYQMLLHALTQHVATMPCLSCKQRLT